MTFIHPSFRCVLLLLAAALLAFPSALQAQMRMPAAKAQTQFPLISMPSTRGDRKPGVVRFPSNNNTPAAAELKQSIKLTDGATFDGVANSLTPETLGFDLARGGSLRVRPQELAEINFAREDKPLSVPVSVLLRDGSTLGLEELVLANGVAECRCLGGGQITIPQTSLAKAAIYPNQVQIFHRDPGAEGMLMSPPKAWKSQRGTWLLEGKVERGMLAWKAGMSARMVLEFTTNQTDFGMTLFRSAAESGSPYGVVSLLVQDNALSISQFDGQGYVCPVRALPMLFAEGVAPIRHAIYCDAVEGEIVVTRNGIFVGKFSVSKVATKDLDQLGKFISFLGRPGFEISAVQVHPWLGLVPATPLVLAEQDVVEVGAERHVSGEVTGMSAQEITLSSGEKIGREKALLIHFGQHLAKPSGADGMATVELMGGGVLREVAVQFNDGELIARSSLLGESKFALSSVLSIKFARPLPSLPLPHLVRNADTLTWPNGAQLSGTMLPVLKSGMIRWRISAAQDVLEFPTADVWGLQPNSQTQQLPKDGLAALEFRNGDWLLGKLLEVTSATMIFQPPFGAALTLERNQVKAIYHGKGAQALTDGGPSGAWQQVTRSYDAESRSYRHEPSRSPQWRYFNGVHSLPVPRNGNGSGSRGDSLMLELPVSTGAQSMEFTMSGVGGNYMLLGENDVALFSCSISSVRISISRLADARDKAAIRPMGNQDHWAFPVKSTGKSARHQLAFDPIAKRLYVGHDGDVIGTCPLGSKRPWKEIRKILWMPGYSRPAVDLAVGDVWIHPAPTLPPDHASPTPEHPWFALKNGDHAQAQRCAFEGDAWNLETESFGELQVPCERISALVFANETDENSGAAVCRVRLRNAGSMSGTALRLEPDGAHLTCGLGELVFPLAEVSELVWPAPGGQ